MINITYLIKRVLSEYDKSEADKIRLNLSKKTLKFYDEWYDSYYYQNKIEEISKKCNLEIKPEVYHKLRLKLQKAIEKIKEKYGRKRMINISYVIKRVLRKYDKNKQIKYKKIKYNLIFLKKVLYLYDEWHDGVSENLIILYKICIKFYTTPMQNCSHKSKNR